MHQSTYMKLEKISFDEYRRRSWLWKSCTASDRAIFFLLAFSIETYSGVVYIHTIFRGFADTQCDYLLLCNDIKTISPTGDPSSAEPRRRFAAKGYSFYFRGACDPFVGRATI